MIGARNIAKRFFRNFPVESTPVAAGWCHCDSLIERRNGLGVALQADQAGTAIEVGDRNLRIKGNSCSESSTAP